MFPFGWGLSYTSFRFTKLKVTRAGAGLNVSFTVTNTGRRAGDDVAQVFAGPAPSVPAGVQQSVRSLAGFDRLVLGAGRSRRLTIHIGPGADRDGHGDRRAFQYWSTDSQAWATAAGPRRIWVGDADSGSRPAAHQGRDALTCRRRLRSVRRPRRRRRLQLRGQHDGLRRGLATMAEAFSAAHGSLGSRLLDALGPAGN